MSKNGLMIILVLVMICAGVFFWKTVQGQNHAQKVVLARDIGNVITYLMFDLREARQGTIRDVPADGKWHDRVAFAHDGGAIEYYVENGHVTRVSPGKTTAIANHIVMLRMRREAKSAAVMEVEIKAHDHVSLTSHFKIRMQE